MTGDLFNRVKTGKDTMQCGCYWERVNTELYKGDLLRLCPIHKQASEAHTKKMKREGRWP